MNNTNSTISKSLFLATLAGTTLMSSLHYDSQELPSVTAKYVELKMGYSWENREGFNFKYSSDEYEYFTIMSFAEKLVSQSQDIDFEIQEAVNRIFWDLL